MNQKIMDSQPEPTIRGWGCTPTGEVPASAITANSNQPLPSGCLPTRMMRGWQRTALFVLLIILIIIVFVNVGLTIWIFTTLRLSVNSIGPIKIVKGGIQLQGEAYVVDNLIASSILSRAGQPLSVHSYRNFTVEVSDDEGKLQTGLFIKRDAVRCSGKVFDVTDSRGRSVFRATPDEVRINAESLAVDGDGGVTIRSGILTPIVRAPPGFDLELESQTRSLDIRAPQSIFVESRAGSIDITSHRDIKLDSIVGAIKIDAPNIIINNLKQAIPIDKPTRNKAAKQRVYQICACATGKLFLAAPEGPCAAHVDDTELCR